MTATVCAECDRLTLPRQLQPCDICGRPVCPDRRCRDAYDDGWSVRCRTCGDGGARDPDLSEEEWRAITERVAYVAECNVI